MTHDEGESQRRGDEDEHHEVEAIGIALVPISRAVAPIEGKMNASVTGNTSE